MQVHFVLECGCLDACNDLHEEPYPEAYIERLKFYYTFGGKKNIARYKKSTIVDENAFVRKTLPLWHSATEKLTPEFRREASEWLDHLLCWMVSMGNCCKYPAPQYWATLDHAIRSKIVDINYKSRNNG